MEALSHRLQTLQQERRSRAARQHQPQAVIGATLMNGCCVFATPCMFYNAHKATRKRSTAPASATPVTPITCNGLTPDRTWMHQVSVLDLFRTWNPGCIIEASSPSLPRCCHVVSAFMRARLTSASVRRSHASASSKRSHSAAFPDAGSVLGSDPARRTGPGPLGSIPFIDRPSTALQPAAGQDAPSTSTLPGATCDRQISLHRQPAVRDEGRWDDKCACHRGFVEAGETTSHVGGWGWVLY
jgi:hypothetical protein